MVQISLDNYIVEEKKDVHCYAYGFHFVDEHARDALADWCRTRFEVFNVIGIEVSDTGLTHIQAYGESSTVITKSERQMFQGKGRFAKLLNPDVKKKYWFSDRRLTAKRCIYYCLKDTPGMNADLLAVVRSYNTQHPDEVFDFWLREVAARRQKNEQIDKGDSPQSFEQKLLYWYRDIPLDERPKQVLPLIEKMLYANIVPWQNMPNPRLVAAAEAVLCKSLKGDDKRDWVAVKMASLGFFMDRYGN